ncbi:MAG: glycosyltransferase family 4 protein [Anaerolineae bacterium]|nr:glycosyltransferase family 4 protein [Anaerolineae bacterium]
MDQAAQLGLAERVHFLGWQPEVQSLIAQFEVFLAPSLWEGFGLVFLEAMAQARPIISTTATSIPEVVPDGECGLLTAPRDVPGLVAALTRLLDDPAYADHLGQVGRERLATTFSPAQMVAQTAALYQELLHKNTPTP